MSNKIIQIGKATLINGDCMEYMSTLKNKEFDLAVIDPPYGIGASNYSRGGTQYGNSKAKCKEYSIKDWDSLCPDEHYFDSLIKCSKNRIIFGANHFISNIPEPSSSCWIVWDKLNGEGSGYADCELAYTSFKTAVRKFEFRWAGMLQGDMKNKEIRIHPTQKPVKLYEWIFANYAKTGQRILDTHGGSMSSVIAALNLGFEIVCIEKDEEYFNAAADRVIKSQQQQRMF